MHVICHNSYIRSYAPEEHGRRGTKKIVRGADTQARRNPGEGSKPQHNSVPVLWRIDARVIEVIPDSVPHQYTPKQ